LVRTTGYSTCVQKLLDGDIDAISTENAILAGYAAQYPDRLLMVNRPFSREEFGIGLPNAYTNDVKRINEILREMIKDGSWSASVRKHFGRWAGTFLANPPRPRV
jgi:glutamate transport system substrate-binding protein